MLKILLFAFFTISSFALEISIDGAKENFSDYSTFHIKNKDKFLCQETKDDFDVVTEIVCAFSKQPKIKLKPIQNNFFKITSQIKNKTFFIIIKPFKKMKIFPVIFDLKKEDKIFEADVKLSNHWMVIGYIDKIPFIKKDKVPDIGINFPFMIEKKILPYVGGLDIKGNPVKVQEVKDVSHFLKIKKFYLEEKYELCLELIEEVQQDYPNSIFNVELLYYKIRCNSKQNEHEKVIEDSKTYLREYSSDENISEILSLLAKAYSLIGMNTDADYFFDRLFSEHQDSEFMHWGEIYKGKMLEESGDSSKAVKYYELALNSTNDIDIAATAAYKLANSMLIQGKYKEASDYVMKIVKAKPEYFVKDLFASMDMMYSLENANDYVSAAAIANSIINEIDNKHDEYEKLLKDRAVWLSKTDKKQEALDSIQQYLKEFGDSGLYEKEIEIAKDSLFFDTTDANMSEKIEQYNELMVNYQGDTIGDKAIYEKAKLLLENNMYADVLAFKNSVLGLNSEDYPDTEKIIKDSAIGLMKLSLENKECNGVLTISYDYNITLSNEWDEGIYDCAMMGGDFQLSKKIALSNLNAKNLDERKKWLYRYIKVDFATGNYSDVISATKELISLIEDDKESEYLDVYRILFDTYQRLEKNDDTLKAILDIEEMFGLNYKDIDRYTAVMSIGSEMQDNNIIIKYGNKIIDIQKRSKSNPQSPYVEFTLYQAYINKEEFNKALDIIKLLDNKELSASNRSRQKYLLGTVYTKLWRDEEAKESYDEAIKADENSPWAKLAKSAIDL